MEAQNNLGFIKFILCILSTAIIFSLVHIAFAKWYEPKRFDDHSVYSMVKSSIEIVYKPTKLSEEEYEGWFLDAKTKMKIDSICSYIGIWIPELIVFIFLLVAVFSDSNLFSYIALCVLSILIGVFLLIPSLIFMCIVYLILCFIVFFVQNPLTLVLFIFLCIGLGGRGYYVLVMKE